jgi:hypothetical protein
MYYFTAVPEKLEQRPLIVHGIRSVCRMMLGTPLPLIGVRGIRFLAKRLRKWPKRLGRESADLHLGHVVRMQEEIGTGGGGFRFMYAAFLQESAAIIQDGRLADGAQSLTMAGDTWREFAAMAARVCKGRARPDDTYAAMAEWLEKCADLEEKVFTGLRQWVKQ